MLRPSQTWCRVPLPVWGLVLLLLPASALLLTVLILPILQHKWTVVLFTVGVALLGCFLYSILQLLRRTGAATFWHNEEMSTERWHPHNLAAALSALPAMLLVVVLKVCWGVGLGAAVSVGIAGGCLLACMVWGGISRVLHGEDEGLVMGLSRLERDSSHLLSIPEVGTGIEAPSMSAFLRDAEAHMGSEEWRSIRDRRPLPPLEASGR
jgi:hypothetical protein